MQHKRRLLFLQLPQLDNEIAQPHENVPIASLYLRHAARRADEARHYTTIRLPNGAAMADNATLLRIIDELRPDVIAATLYLWNIERTLRIVARLRTLRPNVRTAAGGPEVAFRHPFLFRARVFDAIAVGEGEIVFPAILRAFRGAAAPHYTTVALRRSGRYVWGALPAPEVALPAALPPPHDPLWQPDHQGMAYLETSRGCPLRCTYCRYHHLRRAVSFLTPADVARRVAALRDRAAREIRFVDPTFNAHPQFTDVLRALVRVNRYRRLQFFAEIRADHLTDEQADLLAQARFTGVEVGLQSRDPAVLRAICRPTRVDALEHGVRRLARHGTRITLDVMYGLPLQQAAEVRRTLRCAARLPHVHVQCLQTLLLPGTFIRAQRRRWAMQAPDRPPYGVASTSTLSAPDIQAIEGFLERDPRLPSDPRTTRFVGRNLPDLFAERVALRIPEDLRTSRIPGAQARRAVILQGRDLFAARDRLVRLVRRAIRAEPDMLWQFVLAPLEQEPLDLLDLLSVEIRRQPAHLLDRYAAPAIRNRIASRRVFVLLTPGLRHVTSWIAEAERILEHVFF